MEPPFVAPITHIAGIDVTVDGRYHRQRCAWCGVILFDYDLAMIAVQIPTDGSEPTGPGAWEIGKYVRVDGGMSYLVEQEKLPDDCCASAHPELSR